MNVLARFPRVWCPSCNKTQPMIFDVMKAKDNDAADIVCDEYKGRAPTGLACAPTGPRKHGTNIRVERPRGWRAHRQGRESTGNGGPGNRPSERPISNRGRTATPQAAASKFK